MWYMIYDVWCDMIWNDIWYIIWYNTIYHSNPCAGKGLSSHKIPGCLWLSESHFFVTYTVTSLRRFQWGMSWRAAEVASRFPWLRQTAYVNSTSCLKQRWPKVCRERCKYFYWHHWNSNNFWKGEISTAVVRITDDTHILWVICFTSPLRLNLFLSQIWTFYHPG